MRPGFEPERPHGMHGDPDSLREGRALPRGQIVGEDDEIGGVRGAGLKTVVGVDWRGIPLERGDEVLVSRGTAA